MNRIPVLILAVALAGTAAAPQALPIRPDPHLTPGATRNVTVVQLCPHADTAAVRDVPESEKLKVYAEYGISKHPSGAFEIDHLISLELGGSNDIANLWPQSYTTRPYNAHVKDKLENKLHALVCAKKITLIEAQTAIRNDWIAAYQKYSVAAP